MRNNWYNKIAYIKISQSLDAQSRKAFEAQMLLSKIAKDMPVNNPLKNKSYIAGGAVRDELMGKIPKDIDIVVEAENGGINLATYIAKLLNLREPVIYPTFGTAKVQLKDLVYDGV